MAKVISPAVAACFDIYRRGIAASPTEAEEQAFIRLHAELALLDVREAEQYYKLVHQLRMLIALEGNYVAWP